MSGATGATAPVVKPGGFLSFFGLGGKAENVNKLNNVEKQLNNVKAISVQPAPAPAPAQVPVPAPVSTSMTGGRRSRKYKSKKPSKKSKSSKSKKSSKKSKSRRN
jgi:hypothetical protein